LTRLVVENVVVFVEPLHELLDVGGPAVAVADRVQLELILRHAEPAQELVVQLDDLRVDERIVRADCLDGQLKVLPVAAALRRRIAVTRCDRVELHRLREAVHPVLNVCARDRRGRFRAKRERTAAAIRKGVHLLLHDVRSLPGRALEELGVFEHRRLDRAVAVDRAQRLGRAGDVPPERLLVRKDVVGPARSLDHARSSARNGLRSSSAPSVVSGPCPG